MQNDLPATPRRKSRVWAFVIAFVVLLFLAAALFPYFVRPRMGSGTSPRASVKELALASSMYCADNDERLPLADSWMDALRAYTMSDVLFVDRSLKDREPGQYGFAFFKPISGMDRTIVQLPEKVPLVFQSTDLRRNANGDLSIRALRPEGKGCTVAFLDTHTKFMPKSWPESPLIIVIDPQLEKKADGK